MRTMDDSAVPHRNAFCIYQFITLSDKDNVENAKEWLKSSHDIMKPYTCGKLSLGQAVLVLGSYVEFCNSYVKTMDYFLQNWMFQKYDPSNIIYKAGFSMC